MVGSFLGLVSEDKTVKTTRPEGLLVHLGKRIFHSGHDCDIDESDGVLRDADLDFEDVAWL